MTTWTRRAWCRGRRGGLRAAPGSWRSGGAGQVAEQLADGVVKLPFVVVVKPNDAVPYAGIEPPRTVITVPPASQLKLPAPQVPATRWPEPSEMVPA